MKFSLFAVLAAVFFAVPQWASAQDATVDSVTAELKYVLNTFSFLMHGAIVMFMAAGFAMLEAGSVRTKNVSAIILKNIALYSLAGFAFYLVGYNLMYDGVDGGYFGSFTPWENSNELTGDYAASSDWFFQMVFVATTASIVSGTVAERIKLWSFLAFIAVLTAVIYPIVGAWHWGGGWLVEQHGFVDFAGSTIVHAVGGWAALVGAIILGSRKGRFTADGTKVHMPGSSVPLVGLGTFILWLGWFGFNGGSQLALGSAADANAIANIYINTNSAAAGGVLVAMLLCQVLHKRVRPLTIMNAALGGLVAITASPDTPAIGEAFLIGGVGGAIVLFTADLLAKFKIDDVVGAVPVHLFCGIFGTLVVPFTNADATFAGQLIGSVAIAVFTVAASAITWLVIKAVMGLRASSTAEQMGMDEAELGEKAYPEFIG